MWHYSRAWYSRVLYRSINDPLRETCCRRVCVCVCVWLVVSLRAQIGATHIRDGLHKESWWLKRFVMAYIIWVPSRLIFNYGLLGKSCCRHACERRARFRGHCPNWQGSSEPEHLRAHHHYQCMLCWDPPCDLIWALIKRACKKGSYKGCPLMWPLIVTLNFARKSCFSFWLVEGVALNFN